MYRAQIGSTAVAVKIVKHYSSKKVMEQFEKEMTIMSQVSHTNIVTLFGIIREGIIYFVVQNSYKLYRLHFIKAFPTGPFSPAVVIAIYCLNQDLFPAGPFSPALVMEFLPFGNLKIFLKVCHCFNYTPIKNITCNTEREADTRFSY